MWDAITTAWSQPTPEIVAAIFSAIATVVTAAVSVVAGAWLLIIQLGKEARSAIRQNEHSEALKLKLQVGNDFARLCREASDAVSSLQAYVTGFETSLRLHRMAIAHNQSWPIPEHRAPTLLAKRNTVARATIEIVYFVERWQVLDPRLDVFRIAMNVANHDIQEAFQPYWNTVMTLMPAEVRGQQGGLFPWTPPDRADTQKVTDATKPLVDALMKLSCWTYDIQVEMQNLFLGEIFGNRIRPRQPIDPDAAVLRLDRHQDLMLYFENKTAWGKNKQRIEAETRASFGVA